MTTNYKPLYIKVSGFRWKPAQLELECSEQITKCQLAQSTNENLYKQEQEKLAKLKAHVADEFGVKHAMYQVLNDLKIMPPPRTEWIEKVEQINRRRTELARQQAKAEQAKQAREKRQLLVTEQAQREAAEKERRSMSAQRAAQSRRLNRQAKEEAERARQEYVENVPSSD